MHTEALQATHSCTEQQGDWLYRCAMGHWLRKPIYKTRRAKIPEEVNSSFIMDMLDLFPEDTKIWFNFPNPCKMIWSCTWVRETPSINTGWGMKGLRAALARRTWGYWWMKNWT